MMTGNGQTFERSGFPTALPALGQKKASQGVAQRFLATHLPSFPALLSILRQVRDEKLLTLEIYEDPDRN